MHDIFLRKHRSFIHRHPFGGGRIHTAVIGGSLYEIHNHHNTGLRNHQSFTPIDMSASSTIGSSVVRPSEADTTTDVRRNFASNRTTKIPLKKKLSQILGGSLVPLE